MHTSLNAIKSASKFSKKILSLLLIGHASAEQSLTEELFQLSEQEQQAQKLFALKSIYLEPAKLKSGLGFQMSLLEQIFDLIQSKVQ